MYAYQTIMNPVIDNINKGFELSNIHDNMDLNTSCKLYFSKPLILAN